jgi:hypothetical protein
MFSSQTSTSSICWYRSRDGDFGFQGIFRKNLSPLLYCHPIRDFSLQASRHRDTCVIAPSKSQTLSRNCLPYYPTPIRSRFIPGKSQSIFEIACLFRRATRHQPTCLACSLLFQLHAITQRDEKMSYRNWGEGKVLYRIGASYGCHKLIPDPPHWSDNGT